MHADDNTGRYTHSSRGYSLNMPICTKYLIQMVRKGGVRIPSRIILMLLQPSGFVLIGILGGGVQLGPLGTAATNRPIVPAPGDYDDGEIGGMIIARGTRITRRKPAPVPLCPPQTPSTSLPGPQPGPPRWEASN
jgi:hypothetical protein